MFHVSEQMFQLIIGTSLGVISAHMTSLSFALP
jgi:hypothetical protein